MKPDPFVILIAVGVVALILFSNKDALANHPPFIPGGGTGGALGGATGSWGFADQQFQVTGDWADTRPRLL